MKIRVLLSALTLFTGLMAAQQSRHLTVADISVCSNCDGAFVLDESTVTSTGTVANVPQSSVHNAQR